MIRLLVGVCFSFALSLWLARRLCVPGSFWYTLDHPNERSLHEHPTPRSGGLAILAGLLVGLIIILWGLPIVELFIWIVAAMLVVATVSFIDDRRHLSISGRFLAHFIAAGLLLKGGLSLQEAALPGWNMGWPYWLEIGVPLLFIVWMINLYNFMDGMDGFAGGMGVIGFGTFAVLGIIANQTVFVSISLVIAASAGGFLIVNFPPARIFMGDVGSSALGLLVAALSLWGSRDGIFPFWVALLVFSPFIVDATVTLMRRLFRRERVWQAHKTHYYQRLVQLGWGHRKTVLYEYFLMLACSLSAILATLLEEKGWQMSLVLVWCGMYLTLIVVIARLERKRARP